MGQALLSRKLISSSFYGLDVANHVGISSGYTATEDGFIFGNLHHEYYFGQLWLQIDGIEVGRWGAYSSDATTSFFGFCYPLLKGQQVTWGGDRVNPSVAFCPIKTSK